MITEIELKTEFANKVSDPSRWLDSAQSLFSTAEYLEPLIFSIWQSIHNQLTNSKNTPISGALEVVQYQSVYLMLMAYCVENLLKSHIVERERDGIQEKTLRTGELPSQLKTHDFAYTRREMRSQALRTKQGAFPSLDQTCKMDWKISLCNIDTRTVRFGTTGSAFKRDWLVREANQGSKSPHRVHCFFTGKGYSSEDGGALTSHDN